MNRDFTNVLECVWRSWLAPEDERSLIGELVQARVENHFTVRVASDEVRETQEVLDAWQAVRVERHGLSRLDACLEDSNILVLEKHAMVSRGGGHRIEIVRPLPVCPANRSRV